jgi:hypothetical protein
MTRLDRCKGVTRTPGAPEPHLDTDQTPTRIQGYEVDLAFR